MSSELRYTARALQWTPLATVLATASATSVVLNLPGAGASPLLAVAFAGGAAASVALGLDDPMHEMLSAVPAGAGRRLATRVALVGPVAVFGLLLVDAVGSQVFVSPLAGVGIGSIVALAAAGVAVVAVAQLRRPDTAAVIGAGVGLAWALSGGVVRTPSLADASTAWIEHSGIVVAVSAIIAIGALRAR